jgi:hypothetical protein
MLLELGMPELIAEAVVLRHSKTFDEQVCAAARDRLVIAGVNVSDLPK